MTFVLISIIVLQIYTDSAEAKIPAVLDYLGTIIEVWCYQLCFPISSLSCWKCIEIELNEVPDTFIRLTQFSNIKLLNMVGDDHHICTECFYAMGCILALGCVCSSVKLLVEFLWTVLCTVRLFILDLPFV